MRRVEYGYGCRGKRRGLLTGGPGLVHRMRESVPVVVSSLANKVVLGGHVRYGAQTQERAADKCDVRDDLDVLNFLSLSASSLKRTAVRSKDQWDAPRAASRNRCSFIALRMSLPP
jgi:hypothetical protein